MQFGLTLAASAGPRVVYGLACAPQFTSLLQRGIIADIGCFYAPAHRRLTMVVQLGSGVDGWPRILHGGVTAAVVDEAFGFLFLSLRRDSELPFLAPAFTAHLEVSYHKVRPECAAEHMCVLTALS